MKVWLDCDPGHDDAIAILLALHAPGIELVGVSTVHGNAHAHLTHVNAGRLLDAFAAPAELTPYAGAARPLLRSPRVDLEIHGADGLAGVDGLPATGRAPPPSSPHAVEMLRAVLERERTGEIVLVATGPLTNIALLASMYPALVAKLAQIVFMGGGVGIGNRSAVAEYNILCDPEAAQIVLQVPVPKVMIPLNVTHTALFTATHAARLASGQTPLRHTLATLLAFFAGSYRDTFGFIAGPPLHDALTIAYLARPHLFAARRRHVDVELRGEHTAGETVVDVWGYRKSDDSWGAAGKNCLVVESVDVEGFFDLFFECVDVCDKVSPLNG